MGNTNCPVIFLQLELIQVRSCPKYQFCVYLYSERPIMVTYFNTRDWVKNGIAFQGTKIKIPRMVLEAMNKSNTIFL